MPSYNPISKVRVVPTTDTPEPTWVTGIPSPSKYDWKQSDVSAADAGRTEDALMHKMMIAKKVQLNLEWQNIYDSAAQTVLAAFNAGEYLQIEYYDYQAAAFQIKTFYVSDRSVVTYSRRLGVSTLTFNVIEQ